MNLRPTEIVGLLVSDTEPFRDNRGAFARLFCKAELASVLGERSIVQINHSRTVSKGAVRGLHYQREPSAEMKFVRCLAGRVWDVAVDLRPTSETYGHWHAEDLSPENGRMMCIPEGFAHGFQVLEDSCELLYLHTAFYNPDLEQGVNCLDPILAIRWPLPIVDLSARDTLLPRLDQTQ